MKRIRFIDTAKGLGIVLVIIHHTYGFRNGQFFNASLMAMFFLLSAMTWRDHREVPALAEGWMRAKKLILSYLLYLPALILAETALRLCLFHEPVSSGWLLRAIGGMLYSRISIHPANTPLYQEIMITVPMWFVTALAAGYLLFVPVKRLLGRLWGQNRAQFCVVCAIGIPACLLLAQALNRLPVLLPWSLDMLPVTLLFMLAGSILQTLDVFREERSLKITLSACVVSLAVYIILLSLNHSTIDYAQRLYGSGGPLLFVLIGLWGSMFFISICFLIRKTFLAKGLAFFGRHSLLILAFHQAAHHVLFQVLVGRLYLRYTLPLALLECLLILVVLTIGIHVLELCKKRFLKSA